MTTGDLLAAAARSSFGAAQVARSDDAAAADRGTVGADVVRAPGVGPADLAGRAAPLVAAVVGWQDGVGS